MLYDVFVTTIEGKRNVHHFYGEDAATNFAIECGRCDNVHQVDLVDGSTGEISFTIADHLFVYVSGLGDLF